MPQIVGLKNGYIDLLFTSGNLPNYASSGGLYDLSGNLIQAYGSNSGSHSIWNSYSELANGDLAEASIIFNGTTYSISYYNSAYAYGAGFVTTVVPSTTDQLSGASVSDGTLAAISYYEQTGSGWEVRVVVDPGGANQNHLLIAPSNAVVSSWPGTEIVQLSNGNYAVGWDSTSGAHLTIINSAGTILHDQTYAPTTNVTDILHFSSSHVGSGDLGITESYQGQIYFWYMNGSNYGSTQQIVSPGSETHDYAPQVTTLSNGDFVVAWYNSDTHSIEAQLLDPTGANIGSTLLVSSDANNVSNLSVSALSAGGFAVAYATDSGTQATVKFQNFSLGATSNDYGGDGKSDLLFQDSQGKIVSWDMSDHTYSGFAFGTGAGSSWQFQKTGDFDGDGNADLLWRDNSGDLVSWSMHDHQYSGFDLGHVDTSWQVVGAGDFNNDGKSDILWRDNSGELVSWNMNNHAHSGVDYGHVDTTWQVVGTGDFNLDGTTDILWRDTSGEVVVWNINPNGTHSGFDFGRVDNSFQVTGIGDFNGDGNADILWRNTSTGDLISWDVKADGSHIGFDLGVVDPSFKVVDIGDYNGDGKSDIVFRNSATGNVVTWDMNDHTHTGFDFGRVDSSFHLLA
ncbi:VCBS repeat-containing protein [Bradyrhizobium sp. BR 10289]|uniref:FG-GAP repeat domain-containing protein n=1 Tax=Bradyrhizobium sp. BR 10289 TaxID=2749993 RepID=UPI001C64FCCF|nr:VCBS repeat-containing protein [Bradyrhizobium sp. BR 10289]